MLLTEVYTEARNHFLLGIGDRDQKAVIRRFGKEELEITARKLNKYVETFHANYLQSKFGLAHREFTMWYFANYVAPPRTARNFNVVYHELPKVKFISTKISPMQLVTENNVPKYVSCEPEDALFWVVFLKTKGGEAFPVADCRDQEAAQTVEFLLHRINPRLKLPGQ
ncbi:MAG: hypothetical protein P4L51_23685 [Puia sp.]|nr:hypothetical protein [Puia sp.]